MTTTATETTANDVTTLIHSAMLGACAADVAAKSIKGEKESFTGAMLNVARASTPEAFALLCTKEEDGIRTLSVEEGEALKLTRNKAGDAWLIPQGWRNAKSVITGAQALGVPLTGAFNEVRAATKEAREEKAQKEAEARGDVAPSEDGLTIAIENLGKVAAKLIAPADRAQLEQAIDRLIGKVVEQLAARETATVEAQKADEGVENDADALAAELAEASEPVAPRRRRRA